MHDDDSYKMLFTGYPSLDLYYVPTNPDIMQGYGEHKMLWFIYFKVFVTRACEVQFHVWHQV